MGLKYKNVYGKGMNIKSHKEDAEKKLNFRSCICKLKVTILGLFMVYCFCCLFFYHSMLFFSISPIDMESAE